MSGGAGVRPGRELAAVLAAGAAGAGLALLATRQRVAEVIVRAPRPLPAAVTPVSVAEIRPAITALALAALASLAAVLATRGLLRRLTGVITCALGAGLVLAAAARVTTRAVQAAGQAAASPASGAGAGTAAGSATAGSGRGTPAGSLAGLGSRVAFSGHGWQVLIIAGAALVVAAGVAIVVRAARLPAMSGRYERSSAGPGPSASRSVRDSAQPGQAMWDALSAGADPTARPE